MNTWLSPEGFVQNKIGHMRNSLAADQAKEKAKVYAYILVYAYIVLSHCTDVSKETAGL